MATKDKLSSAAVEAAKPRENLYKLSDGGGLYLLVNPDGSRWWRLKYRVDGPDAPRRRPRVRREGDSGNAERR